MCKICKNQTTIKYIGNIKYHFCNNCNFLYKDDQHILNSEEEFLRYQKHNNNQNQDYLIYQETFYRQISEFLGKKVLDFGCGDNHILADIIKENEHEIMFFDKYFYPDENYKKYRYDAVILEEVIEHLSDPLTVLKELTTLLETGGKFVVRTMMIPNDVFSKNWWYLRDSTHISFFNYKTFSYLCELLQMKIIYFNDKDLIILQKV